MKKSKFTECQIVAILKEADGGVAVNEIWRKMGSVRRPTKSGKLNTAGWRWRS